MAATVNPTTTITTLLLALVLPSCALVTVPVKVAGKVVTTTVGLAGKAAGAGIDAIRKKGDDKAQQSPPPQQPSENPYTPPHGDPYEPEAE